MVKLSSRKSGITFRNCGLGVARAVAEDQQAVVGQIVLHAGQVLSLTYR